MIILDKPYVSDFFRDTIISNGFPVLRNHFSESIDPEGKFNLIDEEKAAKDLSKCDNPLIYMPTENSIGWVMDNLRETRLPSTIRLFKDKVRCREILKSIYPDYFFQEVKLEALESISIEGLPMPVVVKPSVGFFSLAVSRIDRQRDWGTAVRGLRSDIEAAEKLFPTDVVDTGSFIIEEFITGEEFAFDAFFDREGKPCVLSAYKHVFASEEDVTDRLYITSADIVREYEPKFLDFLNSLGAVAELRNFPLHVEVRIDSRGRLLPIEINPVRFGGMCTTADLAYHAYGYNLYEYYFSQKSPDWDRLLQGRGEHVYGLVVLNNSTGIEPSMIRGFDYRKLAENFENVLEVREVDFREFHFFGFLFLDSRQDNCEELDRILHSDLRQYIIG